MNHESFAYRKCSSHSFLKCTLNGCSIVNTECTYVISFLEDKFITEKVLAIVAEHIEMQHISNHEMLYVINDKLIICNNNNNLKKKKKIFGSR